MSSEASLSFDEQFRQGRHYMHLATETGQRYFLRPITTREEGLCYKFVDPSIEAAEVQPGRTQKLAAGKPEVVDKATAPPIGPVLPDLIQMKQDDRSRCEAIAGPGAPRQYHHHPQNCTWSGVVEAGSRSAHVPIGETAPTAIPYGKPPVTKENMEEAINASVPKPSFRIANLNMISNRVDVDTPETNQCQLEYPVINDNLSEANFGIMAEDFVSLSDSDEDIEAGPARKCVVCLRKSRFMEDIFVRTPEIRVVPGMGPPRRTPDSPRLLKDKELLISYLHIPKPQGKPNELGICVTCLDHLERFHFFNCAVLKRHEDAKVTPPGYFHSIPLDLKHLEEKVYKNVKEIAKVKQIYNSGTHSFLARRHLTDTDWDFVCEELLCMTSLDSKEFLALEGYVNCREKLSQLYCMACHRMVRNGKKGFKKHVEAIHPDSPVLFPCDICGILLPEKGIKSTPNNVGYFAHWISHFYLNKCDYCDKKYASWHTLYKHMRRVHGYGVDTTEATPDTLSSSPPGPFDSQNSEEHVVAPISKPTTRSRGDNDTVHPSLKLHACTYCGKSYTTGKAARAHEMERHITQTPSYQCDICDKKFYKATLLWQHRKIHEPVKKYACNGCEKRFINLTALKTHVTIHTGEMPFACTLCGRRIRTRSNLAKHMRMHASAAKLATTTGVGRNSSLELNQSRSNRPEDTAGVARSASLSSRGRRNNKSNPKKHLVEGRSLVTRRQEAAAARGTAQSQQHALSNLPSVAIQNVAACLATYYSLRRRATGGSVGALGNDEIKNVGCGILENVTNDSGAGSSQIYREQRAESTKGQIIKK